MEGISIGGGKDRRKKFTAPVKVASTSDIQAAGTKPSLANPVSNKKPANEKMV